jgi:ATP-dependent DNA helicase DinG
VNVVEILGPGGLLARALPGYEPRPSQVEMAERVAEALAERRPLLVEAGTGTGKTLAYLVPAILSGLKVVISTGTKNLQEQIYRKDIPLLSAELPMAFSAACMKGIANYLCLRRYGEHQAAEAARGAHDPTLDAIRAWAAETDAGDRAELEALADDDPVWREVSATPETRLGPRCPHFEACFVTLARRRAQAADLVIVNHHLFFADLALRSRWPQAQILPAYEAVIFDEAHQLEDVATDYFGVSVSSLRLQSLVRDLERADKSGNAPDRARDIAEHVERRADALFSSLRARLGGTSSIAGEASGASRGAPRRALPGEDARSIAGEASGASRGAPRRALPGEDARSVDARAPMSMDTWRDGPDRDALALDTALEELEGALAASSGLGDGGEQADSLAARARALRDDLALLVDGAGRYDRKHVFWAERRGRALALHASPIDVSDIVRDKLLSVVDAAVFTSATLTAGGSFEFVRARLGLESAREARLPSPFDYRRQALLYLPRDLPAPSDERFTATAAERMLALVEITDGRAFLLFTSHRQLRRTHELLAPRITQPVLVQGEKPKHLLVEEFKRNVGCVLFATASFWEGVDVIGEALSLVVIDKLPFAPPDDPLVAARARRLEEEGVDPFASYQLPRAALALAQGFGRLIRHRDDRGIVALLDRRATTRGYGARALAGLPPDCPRATSLDEVRRFWG